MPKTVDPDNILLGHIQINAPDYNEEHADVLPDEPARAHLDPLGLDGGPKSLLATHLAFQFSSEFKRANSRILSRGSRDAPFLSKIVCNSKPPQEIHYFVLQGSIIRWVLGCEKCLVCLALPRSY